VNLRAGDGPIIEDVFTTELNAPWCWNIYLHLPQKSTSFVGKYSSTMEHLGLS
jgi:hypothetical protein